MHHIDMPDYPTMTQQHRYSNEEITAIYRVMQERRDMRHFRPDPVDHELLSRLMHAAHLAPSVGLMQPWRFMRITDNLLREKIYEHVQIEREKTADALGNRQAEFMRLKVEGIRECGELLVVSLMEKREKHIFGRRTLPEMDLASVACAIQNMWLAARAEGIGLGWVSLFDPVVLTKMLHMPDGSRPVAILCVGHVDEFYQQPMLELENWTQRQPLAHVVYENHWGQQALVPF
jgi:5,6-dimethylbenzimidazole synthase